jgi:hypothetical protein
MKIRLPILIPLHFTVKGSWSPLTLFVIYIYKRLCLRKKIRNRKKKEQQKLWTWNWTPNLLNLNAGWLTGKRGAGWSTHARHGYPHLVFYNLDLRPQTCGPQEAPMWPSNNFQKSNIILNSEKLIFCSISNTILLFLNRYLLNVWNIIVGKTPTVLVLLIHGPQTQDMAPMQTAISCLKCLSFSLRPLV